MQGSLRYFLTTAIPLYKNHPIIAAPVRLQRIQNAVLGVESGVADFNQEEEEEEEEEEEGNKNLSTGQLEIEAESTVPCSNQYSRVREAMSASSACF